MTTDADRTNRFNQLAEAYAADLYRYAMWICGNDALARDLVQETFLRAWRALDRLNDLKAAKGWLITILRREYSGWTWRPYGRQHEPGVDDDYLYAQYPG